MRKRGNREEERREWGGGNEGIWRRKGRRE